MSHYIHHVPGRLRVRTMRLKRDPHRAHAAEQLLQDIHGVTAVRANAVTGSIIVNYQRDVVHGDSILEVLAARGYYEPDKVRHADGQFNDLASRAGDAAGKAVFGFMLEKAVERSAVVLIGALL